MVFYTCGFASVFFIGAMFSWRSVLLIISVFPATTLVLILVICPETHIWYMKKGNIDAAKKVLMKLRGDSQVVELELANVSANLELQKSTQKPTSSTVRQFLSTCTQGTVWRPFCVLVIVFSVAQVPILR